MHVYFCTGCGEEHESDRHHEDMVHKLPYDDMPTWTRQYEDKHKRGILSILCADCYDAACLELHDKAHDFPAHPDFIDDDVYPPLG